MGYFILPQLSVAGELRYQRWLAPASTLASDTTNPEWDNLTFAVGVRAHLKLDKSMWLRPGISYIHPIDDPMGASGYNIIQVDVPFAF